MKHNRFAFVAAIWWLIGAACLGALMLMAAPRTERVSASENRMLAGQPELTLKTFADGSFFSGIESWLSDAFFGREDVIALTDQAASAFDMRTEDELLLWETEETDRLLREDAGEENDFAGSVLNWLITSASAEPLPDNEVYSLRLCSNGQSDKIIYNYKAEDVMAFAGTLDSLRDLLGPDGEVHYLQVPVASVGRRVQRIMRSTVTWVSTMEDALQSQVGQGVYVHNAPALMNDALTRHERCYFFTDHHWTELGAWYCAAAIAESRGYPVIPYEEYQYDEHKIGQDGEYVDRICLLMPLLPTHSFILSHLTEAQEIPFMNPKTGAYTSYINNTRLPWRRFDGGFGNNRKALLISDSFGNCFLPYLLPYYGEVHMTDLRANYFDENMAGGNLRELVKYYGIDDIYLVYSTSNGIPSRNAMTVLPAEIAK